MKTVIAAGAAAAAFLFSFVVSLWQRVVYPGGACPASWQACSGVALQMVSNESLAVHLRNITASPHIAGTPENMVTAAYVEAKFKEFGLQAHSVDFPGLLGYPKSQSISIVSPQPLNLPLREASFPEDSYSQDPRASTPFLSYSASGSSTTEVVYANYGTTEDFEVLAELGVSCRGKIVIMRYGTIYRGDKVNNAALNGASGAIIYNDPDPFAPNGTSPYETYPNTNNLPDSGVQRGSIIRTAPGDPLSPGWPSCPTCESMTKEELYSKGGLPTIPAVPLSYGNAQKILKDIGGAVAPPAWQGGIRGLVYHVGPGPVVVAVEVESNITVATVRDVVGVIEGREEPDRVVVLGNHRDAWVFGAADPNSGTACLLEVARILGLLSKRGWRPRRTLVLASWDGEEHNLVGSTEWLELNLPLLSSRGVAYLNADVAVAGPGFFAGATPQLDGLLRSVTALVQDPESGSGVSLLDTWRQRENSTAPPLYRLGDGGSDFAAFVQHAGIASTDITFGGYYPMYHSVYDNFFWMSRFGDPGSKRHVAATQVLLAAVLNLTSSSILPFEYGGYVEEFEDALQELRSLLATTGAPVGLLEPLVEAVEVFKNAAALVGREVEEMIKIQSESWFGWVDHLCIRNINDRLMLAERGFLDSDGLGPNKTWYRHMVYGPTADNGYGTDIFPALQTALNARRSFGSPGQQQQWSPLEHRRSTGALRPFSRADVTLEPMAAKQQKGGAHYVHKTTAAPQGNSREVNVHDVAASNIGDRRRAMTEVELEGEVWGQVQHEIFRVARVVRNSAAILIGKLH